MTNLFGKLGDCDIIGNLRMEGFNVPSNPYRLGMESQLAGSSPAHLRLTELADPSRIPTAKFFLGFFSLYWVHKCPILRFGCYGHPILLFLTVGTVGLFAIIISHEGDLMRGNKIRSHLILATASVALATTLGSAQSDAAIVAVNDGFFGGSPPASTTVSDSISVGTEADMLVVMTSAELGGTVTTPMTVTYGGVAMTRAVGSSLTSAIWYLDLSVGGFVDTDVVVDISGYPSRNGFAAGWVSIDGNLGIGQAIELHSVGTSAPQFNTVDLVTTVETFNVINFNANNTSGMITIGAPIISPDEVIYIDPNIGSARAAAAYNEGVAAGTTTYSWTISGEAAPPNSDYRRIDAAAFAVVGDLVGAIPGDFNNDSIVDAADYTVWRDNLGASREILPGGSATSDVGTIDEADYALWRSNFGATSGNLAPSAVVPEASSLVLLLAGTLAAAGLKRAGLNRRRRLPAA